MPDRIRDRPRRTAVAVRPAPFYAPPSATTLADQRRRHEIAGWDIDVLADGAGLPPGHGDVRQGEAIFAAKCASCHGAHGEGKPMDRLVGGIGTLRTKSRKRPSAVSGPTRRRCSTLSDAPCLSMRRSRLRPTKSTPFRPTCCFSTGSSRKTRPRRRQARQDQDAEPRRLRQRLSDASRELAVATDTFRNF